MSRYKAVRPDGTDFRTGTVDYLAGGVITAPATSLTTTDDAAGYLSVATVPTDCTGLRWPCRLLAVEPLYEWTPRPNDLPNKRACRSLRVVGELPAHGVFGPQCEEVAALIDRAGRLTGDEARSLATAWRAAWDAARNAARRTAGDAARDAAGNAARRTAWGAARDAARGAARDATLDAAGNAALDAARALVVRDLITDDQYRTLAGPWLSIIGDTA